ncbi:MAG: NAD(P)-binding protein [Lachnospiraceae bacterium]|nr:NAD(P)-binding protein [Lachnospiraceae bacterium]
MIQINQIKCELEFHEEKLKQKVAKILKVEDKKIISFQILRKSIDARKKDKILFIYSVLVELEEEDKFFKKNRDKNICMVQKAEYTLPENGTVEIENRPVVIGSGPAGLFCAYLLANKGFCPIVFERGEDVEERKRTVEHFFETGELNQESNVQFGEGGAGTFSDGKLNTQVKDSSGRISYVLKTFIQFGAKEEILYDAKPHVGTDVLSDVVKAMRNEIIRLGGEIRFQSKVTDFKIINGEIKGIMINGKNEIIANHVFLAIGHSARDTFEILYENHVEMEPKSFAIGVRIQHPQKMINRDQYGEDYADKLPAAPYKLTAKSKNNRGVYSFCMCPGGYVVDASSEENRLAINGMSYSGRDGKNANSAIVVSVTPDDYIEELNREGVLYQKESPFIGVYFQKILEERAYCAGKGKIPIQLFGDFKKNQESSKFGEVEPEMKGHYEFANLNTIFPESIHESIIEAMEKFGYNLKGFDREDAILAAVESRTSSPVRINRNENGQSNVIGLYPVGEGAGYAGGIISAAVDGIRAAELLIQEYHPKNC